MTMATARKVKVRLRRDGAMCFIPVPLRQSHREAAGLEGDETVDVRIALDTGERVVEAPADLASALRRNPAAAAGWKASSYTHQREYAEALRDAKKPETRVRRLAATLRALAAKAG